MTCDQDIPDECGDIPNDAKLKWTSSKTSRSSVIVDETDPQSNGDLKKTKSFLELMKQRVMAKEDKSNTSSKKMILFSEIRKNETE